MFIPENVRPLFLMSIIGPCQPALTPLQQAANERSYPSDPCTTYGIYALRLAIVYILLLETHLLGRFYHRYEERLDRGT